MHSPRFDYLARMLLPCIFFTIIVENEQKPTFFTQPSVDKLIILCRFTILKKINLHSAETPLLGSESGVSMQ